MEVTSPYVDAIQGLAGNTLQEKYKTISDTVKRLASHVQSGGDVIESIEMKGFPDILKPLIKLEVGILLRQDEAIVEGLKSEDSLILNRVFKATWFFKGTNTDIINIEYFLKNVLPYISLKTRNRLIKTLAMNLEQGRTKVAEKFFSVLSIEYGINQALPLLAVCSENFVRLTVFNQQIILSSFVVNVLFRKYPNFVIQYLTTIEKKQLYIKGRYGSAITRYDKFLPSLVKNHYKTLTNLREMFPKISIKLGRKSAGIYVEKCKEDIIKNPERHMDILPIKVVYEKLSYEQFKEILCNLYPPNPIDYYLSTALMYLKHCPQDKMLTLLNESFFEKYNFHLKDTKEGTYPEYIQLLPHEERVAIAKVLLSKDDDWHFNSIETSWRCYLPTATSIPMIMDKIAQTSSILERCSLLTQLVLTCKFNDDMDALLTVIQYVMARHANDEEMVRSKFFSSVIQYIDLSRLSSSHWVILKEFVGSANCRCDSFVMESDVEIFLTEALYYNIKNNLPLTDANLLLTRRKLISSNSLWTKFNDSLKNEKLILDEYLRNLPALIEDDIAWDEDNLDSLMLFVQTLYRFNELNKRTNHNKLDNYSIKNYPWLMEKLQEYMDCTDTTDGIKMRRSMAVLKKYESDLYDDWIKQRFDESDMISGRKLRLFKKDPNSILDNWGRYLELGMKCVNYKNTIKFFKISRWYQDIPMKFAEKCLKLVKSKKQSSAMTILSAIYDGTSMVDVLEPLLLTTKKINDDDEDIVKSEINMDIYKKYEMLYELPTYVKISNPPIPFSLVMKFCNGDFLHVAVRSMRILCHLVSASKVLIYADELIKAKQISAIKAGFEIYSQISNLEETYNLLEEVWKKENTHRSVRATIFSKVQTLFLKNPSARSWLFFRDCICNFSNKDDYNLLNKLEKLPSVPIEFIDEYIKVVLQKIENLMVKDLKYKEGTAILCNMIKQADSTMANRITDEAYRTIIEHYLFNMNYDQFVAETIRNFTVDMFLIRAMNKLPQRLKYFTNFFAESAKKYWNVPVNNKIAICPFNCMAHSFIEYLTSQAFLNSIPAEILPALLEMYTNIIPPKRDPSAFLFFHYAIEIQRSTSPKDFGIKVGQLMSKLANDLTIELLIFMSDQFKKMCSSPTYFDETNNDEVKLSIIEGFLEVCTMHANMMAAKMLFYPASEYHRDRFNKIINTLHLCEHPAISAILYEFLNTFNLNVIVSIINTEVTVEYEADKVDD